MKIFKTTIGLVAAVGACAAFAAPAMAAEEFVASRLPTECSEELPCKTVGRATGSSEIGGSERPEKLVFGAFEILCSAKTQAKTLGEGAITWETNPTLAFEIKFTKCKTVDKFKLGFNGGLTTSFNEGKPMKIVYHINGFSEFGTGETTSEVEIGGSEASFKISGGKTCKIDWPAQTVPVKAVRNPEEEFSAATYSNKEVEVEETKFKKFPSHFQQRLVIANDFKGMTWSYEEGQCVGEGGFEEEAKKIEGKTGQWFGSLEEEVSGGNLGVQ
jgi:hypothetical protein